MIYSGAQPIKYMAAIKRLILAITDDMEDAREVCEAIESTGVHRMGQVAVAHGRASRHAGAVMVEWESPDLYRYRVTIAGHGRVVLSKKHIRKILEPEAPPAKEDLPAAVRLVMGYLREFCREDGKDGEPGKMTSDAQHHHDRLSRALADHAL